MNTTATDSSTLSIEFKDLDERIAAFTSLVELSIRECPAEPTFPAALLQLSALRELSIHGARDLVVHVPALVTQLPLTSLRLDNVVVDALVLPPTLQKLTLWSRHAVNDAARLQQKLSSSSVTSLQLLAEGDSRAQPAPGGWASIPSLRALTLSSFQPGVPDFAGTSLEQIEARLSSLDELKSIAATCASTLKSLRVWADSGDVPDEVGALEQLESLALHAPVKTLPTSMSQLRQLRKLSLSNLPTRALPEAIGTLPALEELDVRAQLNTVPAWLAQASTLRRLHLRGALNKGALVSRFDDITTLSPLPTALSLLTTLEELDLSQCGVVDAAPLRPLQRLRVLKMTWSPVTTLDDIGALLALEDLDLEHADRVRDFAPLKHLQRLRVLNISNTRPQSLDVLKGIASLEVLDVKSVKAKNIRAVFDLDVELKADDEVLERFAARQALRRLPPIDAIVERLHSTDVGVVSIALDQLASYVLMSSTRDTNAIESALAEPGPAVLARQAAHDDEDEEYEDDGEDEYDEDDEHDDEDDEYEDDEEYEDDDDGEAAPRPRGTVRWHLLESCIERHVEALPTRVLATLFAALFQQMHEDHPTTRRIADEIVARGDDDDQRALVAAFVKASESYDTGHRMWENTVQDHLIDEVFAQLRQPALVQLLAACSTGHFVDDGMIDLWGTALTRASAADVEQLQTSFEQLATHRTAYGSVEELADWWSLVDVGGAAVHALVQKTRSTVSAQLARRERLAKLQTLCSTADTLGQGLKQLLALDEAELKEIAGDALRRLPRASATRGQPPAVAITDDELVDLVIIYRRTNDRWGLHEVLRGVCAREPDAAAALLRRGGVSAAEQSSLLRAAIVETLRKHEERRGWDQPDDDDDNNADTSDDVFVLPTSDTVTQLRAWAAFVDGNDGAAGRRAEFVVAVERLGRFESHTLRVVIGLLSAAEAPDGGFDLGQHSAALASDVGQCAGEQTNWPALRALARHLDKLVLSGRTLERLLAQLLGVAVNSTDVGAVRCVLQKLPPVVEWDILAYNLACHFAVVGDRPGVLHWAQRSLELGKSPSQFAADHDFDAFRTDADFIAVMASTR